MASKKVKETKVSKEELEYLNNPALDTLPDYLTVNGVVFEKLRAHTENTDLELDDETAELVEKLWRSQGHLSPQSFIREVLTNLLKEHELDKPVKKTKKSK